jgi:hypothetical protein
MTGLQPVLTNKICHFALLHDDGVTIGAKCTLIRNHQLYGIDHNWETVNEIPQKALESADPEPILEVNEGNPWGALKSETPDRESAAGMCSKSPNTRHLWKSLGIGAQSIEVFRCFHCRTKIYD